MIWRVAPGNAPQWWMGRVWYDFEHDRGVFTIVGLHLVWGLARVIWYAIKRPAYDPLKGVYAAGYEAGWKMGAYKYNRPALGPRPCDCGDPKCWRND